MVVDSSFVLSWEENLLCKFDSEIKDFTSGYTELSPFVDSIGKAIQYLPTNIIKFFFLDYKKHGSFIYDLYFSALHVYKRVIEFIFDVGSIDDSKSYSSLAILSMIIEKLTTNIYIDEVK